MSKATYPLFIAIALAIVVYGGGSQTALAQQDNDLQQENLELKRQITDLQDQLQAANNTIEELRRRIDQLNLALLQAGSRASLSDPPEVEVTIDESNPNASPRALFAALQSEYEEAMAEIPMGEFGDRQRTAYLRAVERWVAAANRKHRTKIEWHITPFQPPSGTRPIELNFVAIDPVTHAELGSPFAVPLTRPQQRRLKQMEERAGLDIIVLKGVLVPKLTFRPRVETPGTFNRPRLVGPFAAFHFAINPSSFTPITEEKDAG